MGMQRVTDLADPRRCKGRSLDGQCQNVAEEGADYCRVHGGESRAPARRLKQYLLTTAQDWPAWPIFPRTTASRRYGRKSRSP